MCFRKSPREENPDDGTTVADMNIEGFRWYLSPRQRARRQELRDLGLTPKERLALVFGALLAYLPMFLVILGSFILAFLLLYFWFFR